MNLKYFLLVFCIGYTSLLNAQKWAQVLEEGGSYLQVKKAFEAEWKDKPYQRSSGYKPFKRFENFHEPRLYPDYKWSDPMAVWNELQKVSKDKKDSNKSAVSSVWSPLGPGAWTDGAGWNAGLGRINVVMVDPNSPNIIYVGAPSGGLWKSTNGGNSWSCLTDDQAVLGVSDMQIDPNNSNVIYIATGDGDASDTYSVGVLKSTNGGNTWSTTGLNYQVTQTRRIRRLIMHPTNSNILLAATTNGLFKTTNGGTSWNQVSGSSFQDLAFKPNDPTVVYAVNDKFYKSTNSGNSFTQISTGLPPANQVNRYKIGVSPDEPNWVYLVCGKESNSTFKGMYRSTNSGNSFTLQANSPNIFGYSTTGSDNSGQSWYDLAISVDPNDASTMWVGGVNVWKSTDNGVTYTIQTNWTYPNGIGYTHADIHYLNIYNGDLYCGSDGGVFVSSDGGDNWTDKSEGLQITQFYKLGTSQTNTSLIIGGTQDNGTNLYTGSDDWTHVVGADGMECIINPNNANVMYAAIQFGSIRKSSNGGNSFSAIIAPDDFNDSGAWVTPYVLDPNNSNHIYVGYTELYRSTNSGNTFTQISNLNSSTSLRVVEVCKSNSSVIYVSRNSTILRSSNGGASFSNISAGLPNKTITSIITDPNDEDRVWVSLSGYTNNKKVYFSGNGGSTWTNLSSGLPNLPANCLLYREGSSDEIYVGTDVGAYTLSGNSGNWTLFGTGLPNVVVSEMEITYASDKIRIATYGRGMWETDLPDNCVVDVNPPSITCPNDVPSFYSVGPNSCSINITLNPAQATDDCTSNPDLSWRYIETDIAGDPLPGAVYSSYSTAISFNFDVGYYEIDWKAEDDSGNSSNCDYLIEVRDEISPQPNCINNILELGLDGTVSIAANDVSSGPTDNCEVDIINISPDLRTCGHLGPNDINFLVLDVNGNTASCTSVITIVDLMPPSAICIPTITIGLNNGSTTISTNQIDAGSSDNCALSSMSLDQTSFDCDDLGSNIVSLTVFDSSGNQDQCTTNVIVESFTPVIAICQDINAVLNGSGIINIDPESVDNGSTLDCGVLNFSLNISSFSCLDIGPNDVVLTVDNGLGASDDCNAVIQIEDLINPVMICQGSILVGLDDDGVAEINTSDIDNGSFDNCDLELTLSLTTFGCDDLGQNSVQLIGEDLAGNTSICNSSVNVIDNINPTASCLSSLSITLDLNGNYNLDAVDVDDGSSDNCEIVAFSLSKTSFDCDDVGSESVILTVEDATGNTHSCSSLITILDNSIPSMICNDLTLNLDSGGFVSIDPEDVDLGSGVSCGSLSLNLSQTEFDCSFIGSNQVVLTGTADSGNSSNCTAQIMVSDFMPPLLTCISGYTIELDQSGLGSIIPEDIIDQVDDNCTDDLLFALDNLNFSCTDIGTQTVNLSVTDSSGNTSTCSSIVTVEDKLAPTLICSGAMVELDDSGSVDVEVITLISELSDNCTLQPSFSPQQLNFSCDEVGLNTIVLTALDEQGNTAICEVEIDVFYNSTPIALCQDLTVALDIFGEASITPFDVDAGSNALCEDVSLALSQVVFNCDELGENQVELSVTSTNGGLSSCTSSIIVQDNIAPNITCSDLTVELDFNGNASLDSDQLVLEMTDNCGLLELSNLTYAFDCSNLGTNAIVTEVADSNGNTAQCVSNITVIDVHPPIAICNDLDLVIDSQGLAVLDVEAVGGASFDLCSSVSLSLSQFEFDCSSLGGTEIIDLMVADASGNTTICQSEIVLIDIIAPSVSCQDTEVLIGANNIGILNPESVIESYLDNCSVVEFGLSQTTFDCDDIGIQSVSVYVYDSSGNVDSCTSTITVLDNSNPQASCFPEIELSLDDSGNVELSLEDVYSGDGVSCSGFDYTIEPSFADCSFLGQTTSVSLTIGDPNGVNTQCVSQLTVIDETAPVAVCNAVDTVLMDGVDIVLLPEMFSSASYDACGTITYINFDTLSLDCSYIGLTEIEIFVEDEYENQSSCIASLELSNEMLPLAVCQDPIIYLDDEGVGILNESDVNAGSTDACGDSTLILLSIDLDTIDCSMLDISPISVELLVTDPNSGVTASCISTVSVSDEVQPNINSIDDVIAFSIAGLVPEEFYSTSFNAIVSDNCTIDESLIRRETGDCEDSNVFGEFVYFCPEDNEGLHPVTYRVIDKSGNIKDTLVYVDLDNLMVSTSSEVNYKSEVFCSPNPFQQSTLLHFNLSSEEVLEVTVYSLDGSRVYSQEMTIDAGSDSVEIDLSDFAAGLYFCSIQSEAWEQSLKLVKVGR